MSEVQKSEIIYEEGWRDVEESVHDDLPPEDERPPQEEKEDKPLPLLIGIQLTVAVLAILVLFVLRAADSDVYHRFSEWYRGELQKPVISQKVFEAVDLSKLFSDSVTVKASPDEAERQAR